MSARAPGGLNTAIDHGRRGDSRRQLSVASASRVRHPGGIGRGDRAISDVDIGCRGAVGGVPVIAKTLAEYEASRLDEVSRGFMDEKESLMTDMW